MSKLYELTALELARVIRSGEVRAEDAIQSFIKRVNVLGSKHNALVVNNFDSAYKAAMALDVKIKSGTPLGPLAGVPFTVKLNIDVEGFATTNGARLNLQKLATVSCLPVQLLEDAGAIFIGQTNVPTFSLRWHTKNNLYGETVNPRNSTLSPGGSSGGAAASVAAGYAPIALGTDVAGSIRYPAYCCGVDGFRPTVGVVSNFNLTDGVMPIGRRYMSVIGPLARSVDDLSAIMQIISASGEQDPLWVPAKPFESRTSDHCYNALICTRPGGVNVNQKIVNLLAHAASALESAGWRVEEVDDLSGFTRAAALQSELWLGANRAQFQAQLDKEGDQEASTIWDAWLKLVPPLDIDSFLSKLDAREMIRRRVLERIDLNTVIVMPVSTELPMNRNADYLNAARFDQLVKEQSPLLATAALGLPGLALAAANIDTTPMGIQICSRPFNDNLCLLAGKVIEEVIGQPKVNGDDI